MHVGDRVRLAPRPACKMLGIPQGLIGTVKNVDASHDHITVLISFSELSVYTSALSDGDVEVITNEATTTRRPDPDDDLVTAADLGWFGALKPTFKVKA